MQGFGLHLRNAYLFIDDSSFESLEGCAQGVAAVQPLPGPSLITIGDQPWGKIQFTICMPLTDPN